MQWQVTDHACRSCGGRILRAVESGLYTCADCDLSAPELQGVCCCGVQGIGTAKLRCTRNVETRPLGAPAIIFEVHHEVVMP